MPGIVPRWEWRTFGSRFGVAETRFAALTPSGVQESDEVYLVGGAGDNVKIRDDLMDIKVLRETDADGLERWEPVMKAGVPAVRGGRGEGRSRRCGSQAPALARDAYTLQAVPRRARRAVGRPARGPRAQAAGPVRRRRLHVGGVRRRGRTGQPSRTIAIESEDAAAVVRRGGVRRRSTATGT